MCVFFQTDRARLAFRYKASELLNEKHIGVDGDEQRAGRAVASRHLIGRHAAAALWPERVGALVSYAGYDIIDVSAQGRAPSMVRVGCSAPSLRMRE